MRIFLVERLEDTIFAAHGVLILPPRPPPCSSTDGPIVKPMYISLFFVTCVASLRSFRQWLPSILLVWYFYIESFNTCAVLEDRGFCSLTLRGKHNSYMQQS